VTVYRGGQSDSGLDRALNLALEAELDAVIESGELWEGELRDFPESVAAWKPNGRRWQRPINEHRKPPASDTSLWTMFIDALRGRREKHVDKTSGEDRTDGIPSLESRGYPAEREKRLAERKEKQRYLQWREERVGIVVVHGIGPHLAGQTLLEWTRPIISLINDAAEGDPHLVVPGGGARDVTDPVFKANIDFSGETFPVIHLRIPRRDDVPADDPRGQERRWVVTEAWWASEVRPPTLATMIGWLGAQGGVGRIVQGIQENMLGTGFFSKLGRLSLQPIVSVITSFVLLVFAVLLAVAKVIPIGPLKDAVILRLAASFLTDWFGGARTLLRDHAQSANVRTRLLTTIKALRAYGCRSIVLVAHSGGTMVSLMTLTDPAFPRLRVQKLITIGEALNLGWRLNDVNPDLPPPTPPAGDRMGADLSALQPQLRWRDFWATHDPAPSGQPRLPRGSTDPGVERFSAERVYNRMAISEDHGTYWENDEHFLIPLIREIDVPTGDRAASRFFSDDAESVMRDRRKERVGLLALWRGSLQGLPLLAILAAATVSAPGFVRTAGDLVLGLFGLIPGHEIAAGLGRGLVEGLDKVSTTGFALLPSPLRSANVGMDLYGVGIWTLQSILILLLFQAVLPSRIDRLWRHRLGPRLVVLLLDLGLGVGILALLVAGYLFVLTPLDQERVRSSIPWMNLGVLAGVIVVVLFLGWFGRYPRQWLRTFHGRPGIAARFWRDLLITLSAIVLASLLIVMLLALIGVILVVVRADTQTTLDTERFVIGALGILIAFRLLTRLGTWRWDSWDARERRSLRRAPLTPPFRAWPYLLATVLSITAFAATLLVALGDQNFTWLGVPRESWIGVLLVVIVLIVVVCLGKDIVDNDMSEVGGDGGGSGEGNMDAPPVQPSDPGRAAGS